MKMNKVSMIAAAGSFLVAGAAFTPVDAYAKGMHGHNCCYEWYDHEYTDEGNNHVIGQLTERINAMELAIIEALRLGTGQMSGNMKEQIGADSNLANAQDDRAVVGRIEETRLDAIADSVSGASSCNVTTGTIHGTKMAAGAQEFSLDLSESMDDWVTGDSSMPSAEGTHVAIASRIEAHCGTFANQQDVDSGLCEAVGSLPGASLSAARSVFFTEEGQVTTSLHGERLEAAKLFLLNAITPEPNGAMLADEATTPGGREAAARRQVEASRLSIAYNAATDVLGRRVALNGADVAYYEATAATVPGFEVDFSNGVSWHDAMEVRTRAWAMGSDWMTNMNNRGYVGAVKDNTLINAFQAHISWETYKLLEKQNMILATMLAIQTEQAKTP